MATRGSASAENYFKIISLGYHATQWVSTRYNGKKKQSGHFAVHNTVPFAKEKFLWIRCPPDTLDIFCWCGT
jgi:hypothetical protein